MQGCGKAHHLATKRRTASTATSPQCARQYTGGRLPVSFELLCTADGAEWGGASRGLSQGHGLTRMAPRHVLRRRKSGVVVKNKNENANGIDEELRKLIKIVTKTNHRKECYRRTGALASEAVQSSSNVNLNNATRINRARPLGEEAESSPNQNPRTALDPDEDS